MQNNINLRIYKVSAVLLAVFAVLAPAFGTYAGSDDSSGYDYGNTYSTPSYDYGNTYSTPSYDYGNDYSTPSYDYGNTYSTPSYDYASTYSAPAYNYSSTYSTPTYSSGCSYGCSGSNYIQPIYNHPVNNGCTSNCNHVVVNPIVSGSCASLPSTVNVGQSVTWSANGSGGNGNYTYSWSGQASGSGQTVTNTYNNPGTYTAVVAISSGGSTVTRTCSVYVQQYVVPPVQNNLSVSCYANITNPSIGQSVNFYANAYGGNGNYTYSWSNSSNGYNGYNYGSSINQIFYNTGTQYETVTVNSNGQTASANCNVYVGSNNYNSGAVTVYSNTTPTSGTPTAGVFLSQVPYTGLKGGWNVSLFIFGLFFWSAVIAWFILRKKEINGKFSRSEMIARFKQQNLAQKTAGNN